MIDTIKCIGCRKGIYAFSKENDKYYHVDLFATAEASHIYPCLNSDIIKDHLIQNIVDGHKGLFIPDTELKKIFFKQEWWWDDITTLLLDCFESDKDKANEFIFNILSWSDEEIEKEILNLAEKRGISITQEDYPDLIKWKAL